MWCPCCTHIFWGGNDFHSLVNKKLFDICAFYNCNTCYVIYMITCSLYHIQYVGRTTGCLFFFISTYIVRIKISQPTWHSTLIWDKSAMWDQAIPKVHVPKMVGEVFWLAVQERGVLGISPHNGLNFERDFSLL